VFFLCWAESWAARTAAESTSVSTNLIRLQGVTGFASGYRGECQET
jgi:hypothetical protein